MRTVIADGRSINQYLRYAASTRGLLGQGLDNMLRALDPALPQGGLEGSVPAASKNIFTREIDHRITVGNCLHPVARLRRIAFDELTLGAHDLPGRAVTPGQEQHLIAAAEQLADQARANQPGTAGDEDTHRYSSTRTA